MPDDRDISCLYLKTQCFSSITLLFVALTDTSGCKIISKLKTSTPSGYSISASVVEVLSSRNNNNFLTLFACFLGVCIIGGVLIGITKSKSICKHVT